MSDSSIAIKVAGQQDASAIGWTSDDEARIKDLIDSGKSVRIRLPEDADTEGHQLSADVAVVVAEDDDDVEGHALSLHFPSVQDANDFRRRMIAAGLITATLAVGAAGGAALGQAASGITSSDATTVSGQYDRANQGGTPLAPASSTGQGQYDPANMGGTPQAPSTSAGQGEDDTFGGMPRGADVESRY